MKIEFKILLPLILFCTVFLQQINAQEGSGNWKRSQTDRTTELFVPAVGYMGKQISRVIPTFLI